MNKTFKIGDGKRIYAIGDIHGYAETLEELHTAIEADVKANPVDKAIIIYVGDYIDRGPNSKGVVDILLERELFAPHFDHVFLLGNHEDAMLKFINDPHGARQDWLEWGGIETIESYGIEVDKSKPYSAMAETLAAQLNEALPINHREFYKNLALYHVVDEYVFVHAGIQPGVALEKQTLQDLTFTREPFMSHEGQHEYRVVHGHTPPKDRRVDIRPNRINVDTGRYMDGPLSAAVIEGGEVRVIECRGDI